jgi:hypothetical protein
MNVNKPKVVLIGDTSLNSPHFGCQLVGQTFREQFSRSGLELKASLPFDFSGYPDINQILENADLVVINGEGSIHHGRYHHLIELADQYPSALVNCVYQENPEWSELKNFVYISARESYSAKEIGSQGVECNVVPDVLFASALLNSFVCQSPIKEYGVTDNAQKTTFRLGPFKLRLRIGQTPKQKMVADYLNFLCQHKRLCIGRFHAAIAASVLGIPFSTWDSNTWKMRGLMNDMDMSHLHFSERREAINAIPESFDPKISDFAFQAKQRIEAMFDTLANIARINAAKSQTGE